MELLYAGITTDTVRRYRELVAAAHSTSQRCEELWRMMSDGIVSGAYDGDELELLRDRVVRWSSTFNMINRFKASTSCVPDPNRH
jgi:hypothetical protein